MNHFYPKIPTGAQISTQRPTLLLRFSVLHYNMTVNTIKYQMKNCFISKIINTIYILDIYNKM